MYSTGTQIFTSFMDHFRTLSHLETKTDSELPMRRIHHITSHHMTQSQTPKTIIRVPKRAYPGFVSSPKSIPTTAVATNVVALVTGTAREMGVCPKMAKKEAEAERLSNRGSEYCHVMMRFR